MAQEAKRGCGYRHVHGLYLVGDYIPISCDRLPFPLDVCPCCGQGITFFRGIKEINPSELFKTHDGCIDKLHPCFICDPIDEPAYLMWVGKEYTTKEFIVEAQTQGVSKRLAELKTLPKNLIAGKTIIYLAHNEACEIKEPVSILEQAENILEEKQLHCLIEVDPTIKKPGIFCAFIPQRIEKLFWESEKTEKLIKKCKKNGITPVFIKDGDKDHI